MPQKAQDDDLVVSLAELTLARSCGEREAFLRGVCGGDAELFSVVWSYVEWERRMNGFLLDPLYPPLASEHPFEPGDLLDHRFRIVREVAQGGMGVVYEAVDEKLQRRIALKCGKSGFRKRLPPEARHATSIAHPNVCKMFEIHTAATRQGEMDFITMEFLEGETLADRLRRGRLPGAEARAIARQICAGLAEAHRNQVIHGDLKSANIILTKGSDQLTRAVITDFGLARPSDAAQVAAQSGEHGGTPDYMAPELWKGGKATFASDLYALGVILHELATGQRPFEAETSWEDRLTLRPPPVNHRWDRVLARCLDPDPARRFRDAGEAGQALAPPRSPRWLLLAAASVVLAAGATGLVTYQSATAPKTSWRLAMAPVESSPALRSAADRLSRETAAELQRLKGGKAARLAVIPFDPASGASGATHLLRARLLEENGKLVLRAVLADARTGSAMREWNPSYTQAELRFAPVALAGMVTAALKLPALAAAAAVNSAARQDYWNGLWYLRWKSTVDRALPLLERAVAEDPDSPLTHAALAEAQWLKYNGPTKDRTWLASATESEREAEIRNPDLAEVHRVAGLLRLDAGRYEQAAAEYLRAIELDPANCDAFRRLGMAYARNNQLDEALAAYQRAIQLDPRNYRNYQDLGSLYNEQSNDAGAVRYFRKAVELAPKEPDTHYALGAAHVRAGRFAEAESELHIAAGLQETNIVLDALGVTLMYQGRDREAIPYMERALKIGGERYLWWVHLGTAYRRANRTADSARANRRGLELAEAEMRKNPRSGAVKACLAYLCARLGDKPRAESEAAQALQLAPYDEHARWWTALTYEALGRRRDTLDVLAASPPEVIADLNRWPELADLRADSRFQNLLASKDIQH